VKIAFASATEHFFALADIATAATSDIRSRRLPFLISSVPAIPAQD
jgi:hypothetical protein